MPREIEGPPEYLLVTFLVTRDGEAGHPMDTIVKRVDLTVGGSPAPDAMDRLADSIAREIARKAAVTTLVQPDDEDTVCPVGDPDCMYGDGHCHDACEPGSGTAGL